MSTGAAAAAAAAAAARRRLEQQEEEEMTPYQPQDLSGDWEFKILRSFRGVFRDPAKLREALDQEARAGWVLVEKFDDTRIRLKRPASARSGDAGLDFDPYRTNVGITEGKYALAVVGITLLCMLFFGFVIAAVAIALD